MGPEVSELYSAHGGMVHLNGNLLCAVDVETTGIIPGFHDLIQVAALPLNADLEPLKTVPPFYMNLKPEYPERADYRAKKVTGLSISSSRPIR
jgi:DNA polymerase III epsilon subunit-like protein